MKLSSKSTLSSPEQKSIYLARLRENLQNQLVLYAAVNESRRTQSLEQKLNNISDQINHLKGATATQVGLIESLRAQIPVYQTWSANEQQRLREEAINLERIRVMISKY